MDERETNPLSFDFGKPLPATFTVDDGKRVSGYVLLNPRRVFCEQGGARERLTLPRDRRFRRNGFL